MKSRILCLLILHIAVLSELSAQLDTRHWVPPFYAKPGPGTGTVNIRDHFVTLSTLSESTVPVVIRNGLGQLIDIVEIDKDNPAEYLLGSGNADNFPINVVPTDSLNTILKAQGLTFTSFQPFFVNMKHKSNNQGTSLTSKGRVALGQRFYSGHLFTIYNATLEADLWNNERRAHFISVMATEDNTTVTFDLIKLPIALIGFAPGESVTVTLNANESYVVGIDHSLYNNASINSANGTRISSDKNIVVNTGSWLAGNQGGQDIGSDQIVPAEVIGQEYILVKGLGDATTERPIVVAIENNTQIFLNGSAVPAATINEGEFYIVPAGAFSANDNLYILASERVYVYQTLSGSSLNPGPTVGLNFIPPLNCVGAREVNLAFVNSLAAGVGQGRINIIAKLGAEIFVNEDPVPLTGGLAVPGINDWITYAFDPPTENVLLVSDSVMNVALLTRDNFVGTAGYFSGFTVEPVIGLVAGTAGTLPCVPGNAIMQVSGFDSYQWYLNGEPIAGATGSTLIPEFAGFYSVDGFDEDCGFIFRSTNIDLPLCPSTIGAAKNAENVQETAPGSKIFDVDYRVYVQNFLLTPAFNIQATENIQGGLPVGATVSVLNGPVLTGGVITGDVNPNFDGITDTRLLSGEGTMPGTSIGFIDFTLRIDMNNAEQDGYFNQIIVTTTEVGPNDGITGPFTGQDFSHQGTVADPNGNGDPNEEGENDQTLVCFFSNEINYDSDIYCITDTDQEITLDGINQGSYTAMPEGLELDQVTGLLSVSLSLPGTYTVTFTTGGRCPSVTTTGVTIVDVSQAGTQTGDIDFCADGSPIDLFELLEGADSGGAWTDTGGNPVDGILIPTTAGQFEFTYTVGFAPCEPAIGTISINIIPEPNPGSASSGVELCSDGAVLDLFDYIQGEEPGGVWLNEAAEVVPSEFTAAEAGTYVFTYQVENETCGIRTTEVSIQIVNPPFPGISAGEFTFCVGDEVVLPDLLLLADGGGVWTDSLGTVIGDIAVPTEPGSYTFTYTVEVPPCEPESAEVTFDAVPAPMTGTGPGSITVCQGDPAFDLNTLITGADEGGQWTDFNGNPVSNIFNPTSLGSFIRVYRLSNDECGEVSISLNVVVTTDDCGDEALIIPQGYSPNNDGIGDRWVIRGLDAYPNNTVKVFNRWGAEVFSARPYQNTWDGRAQSGVNAGADLPVGTYWYILDLGDGSDPRRGYVYLNR